MSLCLVSLIPTPLDKSDGGRFFVLQVSWQRSELQLCGNTLSSTLAVIGWFLCPLTPCLTYWWKPFEYTPKPYSPSFFQTQVSGSDHWSRFPTFCELLSPGVRNPTGRTRGMFHQKETVERRWNWILGDRKGYGTSRRRAWWPIGSRIHGTNRKTDGLGSYVLRYCP